MAVACSSGSSSLPPYGEALLIVDTDVPVPLLAGRLRVDLYSADGVWYQSRDIARPDPADWPVSFGVYTDDTVHGGTALVRLRTYPEGDTRDYIGERFEDNPVWVPPTTSETLEQLCASPPVLALGGEITQRRGTTYVTSVIPQDDCVRATGAGAVAATVNLTEAGIYRFEVSNVYPDGVQGFSFDTTLAVRATCADEGSQIACNDDIDAAAGIIRSRLLVELQPGTYTLIVGGHAEISPVDVTLHAALADEYDALYPLPIQPPVTPSVPDEPRLLLPGGIDGTPASEPEPQLTIDRLVQVDLEPGRVGAVRVTMHGDCLGTMAMLSATPPYQAVDASHASTCIDTEKTRVPVAVATSDPDLTVPASVQGAFGADALACDTPAADSSPVVCVPGGVSILGSAVDPAVYNPQALDTGTTPERPAVMSRFWMDRDEVSVGQWRAAVAAGLVVTDDVGPEENPGPIAEFPQTSPYQCSYSAAPVGREDFGVNCVGWYAARDYCHFQGGDLPTEAQWEYAATSAARPVKTRYAWGGDDEITPSCDQAIWGRGSTTLLGDDFECVDAAHPYGPQSPSVFATTDVTPVIGIVGLGGNEREWTLDSAQSFDSPCWHGATVRDPKCYEDDAPLRGMRGDCWRAISFQLIAALRLPIFPSAQGSTLGFRCAYPSPPPTFVGAP